MGWGGEVREERNESIKKIVISKGGGERRGEGGRGRETHVVTRTQRGVVGVALPSMLNDD